MHCSPRGWLEPEAFTAVVVAGNLLPSESRTAMLVDNHEWNHGMTWKLGLYAVDPADPAQTRTARPKAIAALATAAQTGRAP